MLNAQSIEFFKQLLCSPGPSGFEAAPARLWRAHAETFADTVTVDVSGNSFATLNPNGAPHLMLAGHMDEIGLMITHITDEGLLRCDGIGGWDPQVLVGQRILVLGRNGPVRGVIGKKPIHLMKSEEKEKASKLEDLWVDIGADSREDAAKQGVRVGDPAVIDAAVWEMPNRRLVSRSIDNRVGSFVVLEALRTLALEHDFTARVTAAATAQEEIGHHGGGARPGAYTLDPQVALVVDVTFATDVPGVEKNDVGEHAMGSGPVLGRGSATHPLVFERLAEVAEENSIPYTIQASPRYTSTDADAIYLSRAGVATAVISIPNRYMHSPNEMISLDDVEATIRLIAAFARRLTPADDFLPR